MIVKVVPAGFIDYVLTCTGLFEDTTNTDFLSPTDYLITVYDLLRRRFERAFDGCWCD